MLSMPKNSGSLDLDAAVLRETRDELARGWADGPWRQDQMEPGATISLCF